MTRLIPFLVASALLAPACGPEPHYSSDIGVQALPVDPGALAGTFGLYVESCTVVDAPLIGETPSGGDSWYLVTRTWDPDAGAYAETHRPCGGTTFETAGTTTTIPLATWRSRKARSPRSLSIDDAVGTYAIEGHLELWGLEGLPDPYGTPLPPDEDTALAQPFASWIVDMDHDGHPGMTAHVQSIVTGDHYFVQRRVFDLDGVTLGPDRVIGLARVRIEKTTIGATSSLLESQTPQRPDPDPKRTWFEMKRVDAATDCDALTAMVEAGDIGLSRPF